MKKTSDAKDLQEKFDANEQDGEKIAIDTQQDRLEILK